MTVFMDNIGLTSLLAVISAGLCGVCAVLLWMRGRVARLRMKRLRQSAGLVPLMQKDGLRSRSVRYAVQVSHRLSLQATTPLLPKRALKYVDGWLGKHAQKAGIEEDISAAGLGEAALRLSLVAGAIAAVLGMVFSTELAFVAGCAGVLWGVSTIPRSIKRLTKARACTLERDLSEMLEVVVLGLRSGLAFNQSFQLYGAHFSSELARVCISAERAWTFGLTTREQALRAMAASYDSPLLARVVEGMVRSLRFGTSLADSLEAFAVEARAVHRARVEEQVAKAPVKMMLPTGALILPAMLLLVLGPVLLELMEGF